MRGIWHVLGALAVVTALAYTRDTADPIAIAGTPAPLSVESMRVIADGSCERPAGYRAAVLQMHWGDVVEVGVTADEFVVCTVSGNGHTLSKGKSGPPGGEYFSDRQGLVKGDESVEVGRVGPEVSVLEFVLPSGKVVKAELHGDVYLCRVPEKITWVRIRAYDVSGRLLRDAVV